MFNVPKHSAALHFSVRVPFHDYTMVNLITFSHVPTVLVENRSRA